MHAGQGCAMQTRVLLPRSRYDEGVEILDGGHARTSRTAIRPIRPPCRARRSARSSATGCSAYIREGHRRGRRAGRRRRPARPPRQGLLRRADAVRRRRQLHDDRPGGDLRPGARRDPLRRRRRRDPHRQRQQLRAVRRSVLGARPSGPWPSRTASAPGRSRVNGGMWYGADGPYGGYKTSGIGRQNGVEGFETVPRDQAHRVHRLSGPRPSRRRPRVQHRTSKAPDKQGVPVKRPMEGVRIVEVAQFTFTPAAGAVLADWGADVIKVEHAVTRRRAARPGQVLGLDGVADGSFHPIMEHPNRGKRSIGLALEKPAAARVLRRAGPRRPTCSSRTSCPARGERLRIDVDDIRAVNPDIIYVRGSGFGARGPDAGKGGYDGTRVLGHGRQRRAASRRPTPTGLARQPAGAYGDSMGGMTIAGGIAGGAVRPGAHRRAVGRRRVAARRRRVGDAGSVDHARCSSGEPHRRARAAAAPAVDVQPARRQLQDRPTAAGSTWPCCSPAGTGPTSAGTSGREDSSTTRASTPPRAHGQRRRGRRHRRRGDRR